MTRKELDLLLNDVLNKALITKRIQQPSSNNIAQFTIEYLDVKQFNETREPLTEDRCNCNQCNNDY